LLVQRLCELGSSGDGQFLVAALELALDGAYREVESFGDVLVRVARGGELRGFGLGGGQMGAGGRGSERRGDCVRAELS
jgi:hypothetical protein